MSKYGQIKKAHEKIQTLYRTKDAHDYNLALCLAELGEFHEALICISGQAKNPGMVSNYLKHHRLISILKMKGDIITAAKRAFDFSELEEYKADSVKYRLIRMSFLFKSGQCAFEAGYYGKAYNMLKDYTNALLDACNDADLDVRKLKEAILRIPKVASMTKACLPEVEDREKFRTKRERKEHLKNSLEMLQTGWQYNLENAEFCISKDLPMEGALNGLMHQCAVCHVLSPNAAIEDLLPFSQTEYIVALFWKLGWYDEIFQHQDFSNFYHLKSNYDDVGFICMRMKVLEFFHSIGYSEEAKELCHDVWKSCAKDREVCTVAAIRLSHIHFKQKSYLKCQELQQKYFKNQQAKFQYGRAICLACLNKWTSVLKMSEEFLARELDWIGMTGFENMALTPVSIQHVHMLRGWCYKKMKSYTLAYESFNLSIEGSINPFTVYLQKIHTAYMRGHHRASKKYLAKIFQECPTMKKLLKCLSDTLEEYPYFVHDWHLGGSLADGVVDGLEELVFVSARLTGSSGTVVVSS